MNVHVPDLFVPELYHHSEKQKTKITFMQHYWCRICIHLHNQTFSNYELLKKNPIQTIID